MDPDFPHSLTITLPLPSPRLATIISRSLAVDQELSPLVQRAYTAKADVLEIRYKAATARMLRVASNGAFESLTSVLRVCEELDVEVLDKTLS